jgi:hypothetical protein
MRIRVLNVLAVFLVLAMVNSGALSAQSGTSCALAGIISDKTGAVVPFVGIHLKDAHFRFSPAAGVNKHDVAVFAGLS